MRKYVAEFIGTFVLTLFGCGAAALSGGVHGVLGVLGIAMAFGLSIVAMAYAIGDVSGCHINPAVSIGCLCAGKMKGKDCVCYIIAQCLGAICAAGVLLFLVLNSNLGPVAQVGLGADGYGKASFIGISAFGAVITEIILTFVFVLVVLGVTSNSKTGHMGGIVIGLTLAFVHILGIPITGTSVNPARSIGPALLLIPYDGGAAASQLWVFILAPIIGGIIAALVWKAVVKPDQDAA